MKKIIIILLLFIAGTVYAAPVAKIGLDNDNGTVVIDYDGTNLTIDKDGAGAIDVLDENSLNTTNLSLIDETAFSSNVQTMLSAADYDAIEALLGIAKGSATLAISDTGEDTTKATDTFTPGDYDEYTLFINNSDDDGANVSLTEGTHTHGDKLRIINISANIVTFTDDDTVFELASGQVDIGQFQVLTAEYVTDRWVQTGGALQTLYIGDINLSGGTIQGGQKVLSKTGDYTLNPSTDMGAWVRVSGAGTITVESDQGDTPGQGFGVFKTTASTVSIKSNDTADQFWVPTIGLLTAGNEVDLGAANYSYVWYQCLGANIWMPIQYNVDPTDGGAPACTIYDYYGPTGSNSMGVGKLDGYELNGTIITPDSSITVCNVGFYVDAIVGSMSSYDMYFVLAQLSGTTISTVVDYSAEIDGDSIVTGSWNEASINASLTSGTSYALFAKIVADGAGETATGTFDGSNYVDFKYTTSDGAADMTNTLIATTGLNRWDSADGSRTQHNSGNSFSIRIYE